MSSIISQTEPEFQLLYSLLPSGSIISTKDNVFGWTITYPTGFQEDLAEYVQATPGLGLRIIRSTNK